MSRFNVGIKIVDIKRCRFAFLPSINFKPIAYFFNNVRKKPIESHLTEKCMRDQICAFDRTTSQKRKWAVDFCCIFLS